MNQTFSTSDPIAYRNELELLERLDLIEHAKAAMPGFTDEVAAKRSSKQIVDALVTAARQAAKPPMPMPAELKQQPKIKIKISNSEGPGGRDDVPVGVNGYVYQIKREHVVAVPKAVVEVLRNARVTNMELQVDGSMIETDYPRFNVQELGAA
jgi:hypothetical protein